LTEFGYEESTSSEPAITTIDYADKQVFTTINLQCLTLSTGQQPAKRNKQGMKTEVSLENNQDLTSHKLLNDFVKYLEFRT
jgi:hypothetical protein